MDNEVAGADARESLHIAQLWEVESIRQLKAKYCRYLDTKDWVAWRGLFTDDFIGDTSESGGELIAGADAFVAFTRGHLGASKPTVHQVHAPEIGLTSPTTARGIWALHDVVRLSPGLDLQAYGHYHETYEKRGGRWYLETSKLTRLREDLTSPVLSVRIPARLRDVGAALARKKAK